MIIVDSTDLRSVCLHVAHWPWDTTHAMGCFMIMTLIEWCMPYQHIAYHQYVIHFSDQRLYVDIALFRDQMCISFYISLHFQKVCVHFAVCSFNVTQFCKMLHDFHEYGKIQHFANFRYIWQHLTTFNTYCNSSAWSHNIPVPFAITPLGLTIFHCIPVHFWNNLNSPSFCEVIAVFWFHAKFTSTSQRCCNNSNRCM